MKSLLGTDYIRGKFVHVTACFHGLSLYDLSKWLSLSVFVLITSIIMVFVSNLLDVSHRLQSYVYATKESIPIKYFKSSSWLF